MFNGFKYLELTRHHIFRKAKAVIADYSIQEGGDLSKLEETVFSSTFSLFLTSMAGFLFANNSKKAIPIWYGIVLLIIAIALYCFLFLLIRKAYSFIVQSIKQARIYSADLTAQNMKELIDDFDHITFDHLIISFELLEEINTTSNLEVCTFYFHEVLYYLKSAVRITKEVTESNRRNTCLNIWGNTNGIDVFRLINAHKMMSEVIDTVKILVNRETSRKIQVYNDKLENVLTFQIGELTKSINIIGERCEQAIHDLEPVYQQAQS